MALDTNIRGTTGTQAGVDANNNLTVNLPTTLTQAGYTAIAGEVAASSAPGGQLRRVLGVTDEGRARVAVDRPVFYVEFGGSATSANAIPQDALKQTATTMTASAGSPNQGFLWLNSGSITTITTGIQYQTYTTFQTYGGYGTRYEFTAKTTNCVATSGKVVELGVGLTTNATSTGLLDGFCFRWTAGGLFQGVLSINGTETTVTFATTPTDAVAHRFTLTANQDGLEFYVDKILQGVLPIPVDQVGTGLQTNLPLLMRIYNLTAPTLAASLLVGEMWVTQGGMDWNKPWSHIMAGMGQTASSVPYGTAIGTSGTPANVANVAIPTTAAASNTAALVTGIGGVAQFNAVGGNLAAANDLIITSYQIPIQTATQASKRLHVTGIRISSVNMGAAAATTPTTLLWRLAWGHTAVSLATGEGVAAKAPRFFVLGFQSVPIGGVVGQPLTPDLVHIFSTPIVVNPAEFIATTARFIVGTATASQTIVSTVGIEGYWE